MDYRNSFHHILSQLSLDEIELLQVVSDLQGQVLSGPWAHSTPERC
jgi:hypothetical protein